MPNDSELLKAAKKVLREYNIQDRSVSFDTMAELATAVQEEDKRQKETQP